MLGYFVFEEFRGLVSFKGEAVFIEENVILPYKVRMRPIASINLKVFPNFSELISIYSIGCFNENISWLWPFYFLLNYFADVFNIGDCVLLSISYFLFENVEWFWLKLSVVSFWWKPNIIEIQFKIFETWHIFFEKFFFYVLYHQIFKYVWIVNLEDFRGRL